MFDRGRVPAYKSLLLATGVLLIVLGAGNWMIGAVRSEPYVEYLRENPGPRVKSPSLKAQLLEPPDDAREERDVSRAKLEFYQLVQSGGRLMVLVGAMCLLGAMVSLSGFGRVTEPRIARAERNSPELRDFLP